MANWISQVDRIVKLANGASVRFQAGVERPLTPQFEGQAIADGCRKVEEEAPAPKRRAKKKEAE